MSRQGAIPIAAPVAALALGLCASLPAGTAATAEDPARGHDLAVRWCTSCHVVDPALPGGDAGPPFTRIAATLPAQTVALRVWLTAPHDPMPDLDLSRGDIADILAYLRMLAP